MTPLPPVAVIECTQTSPQTFQLSGGSSYDPDGVITGFTWDFGDGETAQGQEMTYRYSEAGVFTIALTVTDDSGMKTTKYEHVTSYYEIEVPNDFATIQKAIEAATDGDVICVSPGTYVENIDFLGKAIVVKAQIVGSATIQAGAKEVSGSPLPAVRFHNEENRNSILEGFIIQGPGPGTATPHSGAGINISGASPTIRNCTLQNCTAAEGGAVYAYESNCLVQDCKISNCTATINGGGVLMIGESVFPELRDCAITSNRANAGGGIYIFTTHETRLAEDATLPVISGCDIASNYASGNPRLALKNKVGGGIEVGTGCRYEGEGNTFRSNTPCDVAFHDCNL